MTWSLQPRDYLSISATLYGLLLIIPPARPSRRVHLHKAQYGIKYNQFGLLSKVYQSVRKDDDQEKTIAREVWFFESQGKGDHRLARGERKGLDRDARIRDHRLETQGKDWRSWCHVQFDRQVDDGCRFGLGSPKGKGSRIPT